LRALEGIWTGAITAWVVEAIDSNFDDNSKRTDYFDGHSINETKKGYNDDISSNKWTNSRRAEAIINCSLLDRLVFMLNKARAISELEFNVVYQCKRCAETAFSKAFEDIPEESLRSLSLAMALSVSSRLADSVTYLRPNNSSSSSLEEVLDFIQVRLGYRRAVLKVIPTFVLNPKPNLLTTVISLTSILYLKMPYYMGISPLFH
jgi:hypothetical protein